MTVAAALAKLSGIKKAAQSAIADHVAHNKRLGWLHATGAIEPKVVHHYFTQGKNQIDYLRAELPNLFGDFQEIKIAPHLVKDEKGSRSFYTQEQLEQLVRDIEQVFEIRANSELATAAKFAPDTVFISHGHTLDWRIVKDFIQTDLKLRTVELAQQPNLGRTIIEKLLGVADECDSAVIVMTGDDIAEGLAEARVRENVMHEIGFFQGRYGRNRVVLLHEEGVNVPTNLSGVVYSPFPKGSIEASFHLLTRELRAMYKI